MATGQSFFIKLLGDAKGAISNLTKTNKVLIKQQGVLGKLTGAARNFSNAMTRGTQGIQKNFVGIAGGIFAAKKAFDNTIGVAINFESAILKVQAVSGGAVGALEELARSAGKSTVFSASAAAAALLLLAQAGLDTKESQDTLIPTLNLAAAAQIELAEATSFVVDNLTVFQQSTDKAGRFADVMAKTTNIANLNMQDLGLALQFAGPIASQAGITFEGLNASLAVMATQGIRGQKAGRQLRAALTNLIKPTAEAESTLKKFGITSADLEKALNDPIKLFKLLKPVANDAKAAVTIFGKTNLAVASAIKNATPKLEEFTKKLEEAGGTAKTMADIQISGAAGAIKLLKSAFEELVISGSKDGGLVDIFTGLIKVLTGAIRGFQKLPTGMKAGAIAIGILIPAVIALNAALGPIGLLLFAVGGALALFAGKAANAADINQRLKNTTDRLTEAQDELKVVTIKLNDETGKISKAEKALLTVRKEALEIKERQAIFELIRLRSELTKQTIDLKSKQDKLIITQEKNADKLADVAMWEDLVTKSKKGNIAAGDKLVKTLYGETRFISKSVALWLAYNKVNLDSIKIRRDITKVGQELVEGSELLTEKERINTEIINRGAQGYINYRDGLNGVKFSLQQLNAFGPATKKAILDQVAALDAAKKKSKESAEEVGKNWQEAFEGLETSFKKFKKIYDKIMRGVSGVFSAVTERNTVIFANELIKRTSGLKAAQATESEAARQQFEQGLINEEQFNEKKLAIDNKFKTQEEAIRKDIEIKKAKAARKAAGFQKALDITSAIVGGALAVISTLAMKVPLPLVPLKIALAATMGGLAAAQVGIIAATPLPEIPSFGAGGLKRKEGLALLAEGNKQEAILPAGLTALLLDAARERKKGFSVFVQNLNLPNVRNVNEFIIELEQFIKGGGTIPARAIS